MRLICTVTISLAFTLGACARSPAADDNIAAQDQDRHLASSAISLEKNRWMMVEVRGGIAVSGDPKIEPAVWRLDTKSGALSLCFRDGLDMKCVPAPNPAPE
jgi:hypothetical protein